MSRRAARLVLALVLTAPSVAPRLAAAQCPASTVCIPQPGCAYVASGGVTLPSPGLAIDALWISNPTQCREPGPYSIDSFFDVSFQVEITDQGERRHGAGIGHGMIEMDPPTWPSVSAELVALELFGGTLPQGWWIRERPGRVSRGQSAAEPVGGNVDSFFDVFLDFSRDGGQTWLEAGEPMHLALSTLSPTPVRTASTWGAIKLLYR